MHGAVVGARSVPGFGSPADPRLESELRFFSVFYAAYGVALWRAAEDAHRDAARVRWLAAVLFAAGAARAAGARRAGRPSGHQLRLLAVELTAPPVVVAWQARLPSARR